MNNFKLSSANFINVVKVVQEEGFEPSVNGF